MLSQFKKKLIPCALAACIGMLAVSPAYGISARHDLPDSQYVVPDSDFPALVDIEKDDCLATLVHESHLLTVAHCAVDLKAGQSLKINGKPYPIAKVIKHPRWNDDRNENDIALVRLKVPVKGVAPLPLYRKSSELGSLVILLGRGLHSTGLTGEPGATSDGKLRRATNIVSAVNAQNLEILFRQPGQSGITSLEGVGLSGDSGGPVFIEVDGVPQIAGLNSWGQGEDAGLAVGQYGAKDYQTRISKHLVWLDRYLPKTKR